MCRDVRPDCILLDYQLPDLDGLEFLDRFRAEFAGDDVAIIMLTGHGNETVAVQAMKKGVQDYLIKSLNSDSLGQAVRAVILKGIMRRKIEDQRRELEALSAERLRLIAELERRTADLTEADRRKDEFLAMLAHELRNPLAPVRIGLQLLRQADGDAAIIEETCGMLERQVHHMVRLVNDLLDVSRVSRGKIRLCKQRRDFAAAIQGAVEVCRPLIDERRHRLTVSSTPGPLWLEADPVRLEQVVANLLNNAAKYTPPGGMIRVSGDRDGDEVVLRVRDDGIGIAPELLPRIFDMFTQADNSLARTQGGLGIGLTLVQLLVQLHGGSVQALSPGPGLGAEFVVRLPGIPRTRPRRSRHLRGQGARTGRSACWWSTTTWTRPRAWPGCWSSRDMSCTPALTGRAPSRPPVRSGPRSSCSTSGCRGWTATRWPNGSAPETAPTSCWSRSPATAGKRTAAARRRPVSTSTWSSPWMPRP